MQNIGKYRDFPKITGVPLLVARISNSNISKSKKDIQALLASTEEWSVLIDKTVTSGSGNEGTTKDNM